jgi:hypothetical protein
VLLVEQMFGELFIHKVVRIAVLMIDVIQLVFA